MIECEGPTGLSNKMTNFPKWLPAKEPDRAIEQHRQRCSNACQRDSNVANDGGQPYHGSGYHDSGYCSTHEARKSADTGPNDGTQQNTDGNWQEQLFEVAFDAGDAQGLKHQSSQMVGGFCL